MHAFSAASLQNVWLGGFRVWPVLEVYLSAVVSVFGFPLVARDDTLGRCASERFACYVCRAREVGIDLVDV